MGCGKCQRGERFFAFGLGLVGLQAKRFGQRLVLAFGRWLGRQPGFVGLRLVGFLGLEVQVIGS